MKPSICQPLIAETKTIAFKYETFDPISFAATEEKESPFFERIHAIVQSDEGRQAINPASKIGLSTGHYGSLDSQGFLKHG